MIKGMLSNEHRGVRPAVYRVLEYLCSVTASYDGREWWCGVYSGKHSAHGQLRGGRTGIKGDADLDPCERRGTRWHPPSSIIFLLHSSSFSNQGMKGDISSPFSCRIPRPGL